MKGISQEHKNLFAKAFKLLVINIFAMSFIIVFGGGYNFSGDSYGVLMTDYSGHPHSFIASYRFFGAGLFELFRLFGHDPISNTTSAVCAYILIVAAATTWLIIRLEKVFADRSCIEIALALWVTVMNFWYCEILSFPECILMTAFGAALTFLAIGLITGDGINKMGCCIGAGVCLICATGIYQQFFAAFGVYALALCGYDVWKNKDKTVKERLKIFIKPALLWIISGGVYFVIAKSVCSLTDIMPSGRVGNGISEILMNALHLLRNIHSYASGRGYFSSEALTVCFVLAVGLFTVSVVYHSVKDKGISAPVIAFLTLICAVLSSMTAAFLGCNRGTRAMFPFFAVYGFIILVIPKEKRAFMQKAMTCVLLAVILMNVVKASEMEVNLKLINREDRLWTQQVSAEIQAYEQESDVKVNTISIGYDEVSDISQVGSSYTQTATGIGYARYWLLITYSDLNDVKVVDMPESVHEKYFAGKDWKTYFPSEQIVFDGDTAYICCY